MKTEAMPTKTEFKFNCPTCGQHILAATQWSGLGISCPSCQSRINIPSASSDEPDTKPVTPLSPAPGSNPARCTIRIELPGKATKAETNHAGPASGQSPVAGQDTAAVSGSATESAPAPVGTPAAVRNENSQIKPGNEPWPDLVQKLEKGALVEPAELVTALFHELTDVRRRLDQLEQQTMQEK